MAFRYFNPNPSRRDVNDCTVRALCRVTGLPWDSVHARLCDVSRQLDDMPESDRAFGAVLHALGFIRHVVPDLCPDCYTVTRFADDYPSGTFVLALSGHVVTVVDGDWYDTHDCADKNIVFVWAHERN